MTDFKMSAASSTTTRATHEGAGPHRVDDRTASGEDGGRSGAAGGGQHLMRTGHLFAGIDGFGLGLARHGFETAWFAEFDPAPSAVLAHHHPGVPNHGDLTAINWTTVEPVDVLTGGFPCQDISKAGKGAGIAEGTRSGLWFEYARAVRELRPRLVIVENVSALLARGLDIVLGDLAEAGFDAWWTVLRASDVGAAHRRERLFLVAVAADSERGSVERRREAGHVAGTPPRAQGAAWQRQRGGDASHDRGSVVADADGDGLSELGRIASVGRDVDGRDRAGQETSWGGFEPAIRRWEHVLGRPAPVPTVDGRLSPDFVEWHMGFPAGWTDVGLSRNQRLKALGNAVVPQCADLVGAWAVELAEQAVAA